MKKSFDIEFIRGINTVMANRFFLFLKFKVNQKALNCY